MASDFTVERNSTKWVLGAEGVLTEYIADAPAIEFNADGSYKGVLVEPQSINEQKASEDLDDATYWDVGNTTIAGDTETDPKGGTNSFLLSETVANGAHFIITGSGHRPSIGSAEAWTQSIFVKKGDGANAPDIIQLSQTGGSFSATEYANFDISVGGGTSGTVTASNGGTAAIRYYGNGWYRISWTTTSIGAGVAFFLMIFTNNNPTAGRLPTYAGQTDANVFIWGAQLEESPIATSYIPTTTGAVTRLKDDIYLTSASSLIGQTEGTMFVEVDWNGTGVDGLAGILLSINDGSTNNRVVIYRRTSTSPDELSMLTQVNGGSLVVDGEDLSAYTGIQKFAAAYANNDQKMFRNGSEIASTSTSTTGFSMTNVDFGALDIGSGADNQANMWIRAVALFTTRLSDAECEALTTI